MPNYCTVKYIDKTLASASSLQQALLQISVPILAWDNLQLVYFDLLYSTFLALSNMAYMTARHSPALENDKYSLEVA